MKRLREMLAYISVQGDKGRTTLAVKAFMGLKFGLKFTTTASYIGEMHEAGCIVENENGCWVTTRYYKTLKKRFVYAE